MLVIERTIAPEIWRGVMITTRSRTGVSPVDDGHYGANGNRDRLGKAITDYEKNPNGRNPAEEDRWNQAWADYSGAAQKALALLEAVQDAFESGKKGAAAGANFAGDM